MDNIIKLNLPAFPFSVKSEKQIKYIFDKNRKKYVQLTPEEWVRQNFTEYLVKYKNYPRTSIAIEVTININRAKKRCDILVYNRNFKPVLLIECKAPYVKINAGAFEQIEMYNLNTVVEYLIVTNGLTHYCCKLDYKTATYKFLEDIPLYTDIATLPIE